MRIPVVLEIDEDKLRSRGAPSFDLRDPKQGQRLIDQGPRSHIGADPLDAEHIAHLHFELWLGGASNRFDPQQLIETTWEYVPDPGDLPRTLVARNAGQRPPAPAGYSVFVQSHYRRLPRR